MTFVNIRMFFESWGAFGGRFGGHSGMLLYEQLRSECMKRMMAYLGVNDGG